MHNKIQQLTISTASFFALSVSSSLAIAGGAGTLTHAPLSASSVPTLGGAGLVILALLLGTVAVRLMKNKQNSGTAWLVAATCVSALVSGGSGIKLVSDAYAGLDQIEMTNAAGGEIDLPNVEGFQCFDVINNTSATQKITSLDPSPSVDFDSCMEGNGGSSIGTCSDNPSTVLEIGEFCTIGVIQNQGPA